MIAHLLYWANFAFGVWNACSGLAARGRFDVICDGVMAGINLAAMVSLGDEMRRSEAAATSSPKGTQ